jgi:hypothetical protein
MTKLLLFVVVLLVLWAAGLSTQTPYHQRETIDEIVTSDPSRRP